MISAVKRSPFQVRILLGGRRCGKTSVLNAIRNIFLDKNQDSYLAFPVLFNLQQERPENLDHLRYLLIARFQEAWQEYRTGSESSWRKSYRRFLRQIPGGSVEIGLPKIGLSLDLANPDHERRLINEDFRQDLLKLIKQLQKHHFEGVCFLLDGSEYLVSQDWANDAWSYFRALKDTDIALKPFVGFIFSGYRDLKDYQQRVGSPLLNIAEVAWLQSLSEDEVRALISYRTNQEQVPLTDTQINQVITWAGCHPYLTQQLLNSLFEQTQSLSEKSFMLTLIRQHDKDFSKWWDVTKSSYGFGKVEQQIYLELAKQREATPEAIAKLTNLSFGEVADALEVLAGTGIIRQIDVEKYQIGAKLFEQWVAKEQR
ncbi:MAG: TrmB family transcriptional regulator [Moorea sp. SIO2B7]|nr:TrmB family transcriptional regulator [Moorena sp. SIO2B7]